MRQLVLVSLFISSFVFTVKAERVLKREKYDLIIKSDTVYAGEDYYLTVDLKGNENVKVLRNYYPVPVSGGKGYVKFKASAVCYDKNGRSKQLINVGVVFDRDTLFEDITYYVEKPPASNIRSVQDSLTVLLYNLEPYKQIEYLSMHDQYFHSFAYDLGTSTLMKETGELMVAVIVDATGKVVKYDILKNTYKVIPLQKIENAIQSYRLDRKIMYNGNLKFSAVVYTLKGHTGNYIVASEY
ncbi:MAG: hypothetical protein ACTHJT_10545 [Cytophaga sp.]|uniref:hypothetical protein n=1 Tax=Cytophaga sp. TaxID=29535 RepID=UPI003F7E693B